MWLIQPLADMIMAVIIIQVLIVGMEGRPGSAQNHGHVQDQYQQISSSTWRPRANCPYWSKPEYSLIYAIQKLFMLSKNPIGEEDICPKPLSNGHHRTCNNKKIVKNYDPRAFLLPACARLIRDLHHRQPRSHFPWRFTCQGDFCHLKETANLILSSQLDTEFKLILVDTRWHWLDTERLCVGS